MCLQPTSWRLEVNESNLLLSCSVAMLSPTSRRGDVKINTRWRPLISFHSFSSHPLFCPSPLSLYHLPRHLNFPLLQLPLPLSPHLSSAPFSASHLPLRPPFLTFYSCLPLINIFFLSPRPPPISSTLFFLSVPLLCDRSCIIKGDHCASWGQHQSAVSATPCGCVQTWMCVCIWRDHERFKSCHRAKVLQLWTLICYR